MGLPVGLEVRGVGEDQDRLRSDEPGRQHIGDAACGALADPIVNGVGFGTDVGVGVATGGGEESKGEQTGENAAHGSLGSPVVSSFPTEPDRSDLTRSVANQP